MLVHYLRLPREVHGKTEYHPVGCLVVEFEDSVQYAVSLCSKKDQFSKKIGRNIALGRLNKGKELKVNYDSSKHKEPYSARLYKKVEPQINEFLTKIRAKVLKNKIELMEAS